MGDTSNYAEGWPQGKLLRAGGVGEIVESRHPDRQVGDLIRGPLRWAEYATVSGDQVTTVDPQPAPISTALGVLGMPGRTAYFGMLEVAEPKAGETVMVSGAAGAVGSVAAQIAKMHDCRVIGTAGSDQKCTWLGNTAGIDAAINYRTAESLGSALDAAAPDGIDVYFDNVGGEITDAVFPRLNTWSRVAVCGQIALYNVEGRPTGPRKLRGMIGRRTTVQGFLVGDFSHRASTAEDRLADWMEQGVLSYEETVTEGIEGSVDAFVGLFDGENLGKQVVRVADRC